MSLRTTDSRSKRKCRHSRRQPGPPESPHRKNKNGKTVPTRSQYQISLVPRRGTPRSYAHFYWTASALTESASVIEFSITRFTFRTTASRNRAKHLRLSAKNHPNLSYASTTMTYKRWLPVDYPLDRRRTPVDQRVRRVGQRLSNAVFLFKDSGFIWRQRLCFAQNIGTFDRLTAR